MKKHLPIGPTAALGRKVTRFTQLDTFPKPPGIYEVSCISDEVTANCPVTSQPDWYQVEIKYEPRNLCVESKSLKLYLQSFRNKGLFCESFADRIARELQAALKALSVRVTIVQKSRGGISIVARALVRGNVPFNPLRVAR